jgi:hypothetical protein
MQKEVFYIVSEQPKPNCSVDVYLTTEKPFRYEKDDKCWVGYPIATDSVSNVFREHVPSLGECVEVECKFHAEHESYIDRMEDELEELTNKILKLDTFMGTETYEKLTMAEKILMTDQLKAMERYRDCLCDRLKNNNRICK